MFNTISWGQYFSVLIPVLIFYYIIVGLRYYRWEILSLVGIKKVEEASGTTALSDFKDIILPESHKQYLPQDDSDIDISPLIQSFTDEVYAYLQGAKKINTQKNDLLNSLKIILSKYQGLKNADCRTELAHIIITAVNFQYPDMLQSSDVSGILN